MIELTLLRMLWLKLPVFMGNLWKVEDGAAVDFAVSLYGTWQVVDPGRGFAVAPTKAFRKQAGPLAKLYVLWRA